MRAFADLWGLRWCIQCIYSLVYGSTPHSTTDRRNKHLNPLTISFSISKILTETNPPIYPKTIKYLRNRLLQVKVLVDPPKNKERLTGN